MTDKKSDMAESISKMIEENPVITDAQMAGVLGVHPSTVQKARAKLGIPSSRKRSITETLPACPEGFHVQSVSTLTKFESDDEDDGKVVLQWTKSTVGHEERFSLIKKAAEQIAADIHPLPLVPAHTNVAQTDHEDYLAVYPIADVHMAMRAFAGETGSEYTTAEAEMVLNAGMVDLVRNTPSSRLGVVANLGDFFHVDGVKPMTSRGGNILDLDSPWSKMFITGFKSFQRMIELALQNHDEVRVLSTLGNHDDVSGLALMVAVQAQFSDNPRVSVSLPVDPFAYFEFGDVLLGIHHGTVKPAQLAMIMSDDQRTAWGRTKYHHWLCGHTHQRSVHEFPGCVVEGFRAVASRDSWSHGMGYRSGREMVSIRYHRSRGETSRVIHSIDWSG